MSQTYDLARVCIGPDVSNVNGRAVTAADLRSVGAAFCGIKVSQGVGFTDSLAQENEHAAKAAGVLRVRYAFLESDVGGYHPASGTAQADHFIDRVHALGGPDGVAHAIDVELQDRLRGPSYRVVQEAVARWHQRMPGHPLGVYSGGWYWSGHLGNPQFVGDWLWESGYVAGAGTPAALLREVTPGYWQPWGHRAHFDLRQYTSSARMGAFSRCDFSVFGGSIAELRRLTVGGGGGGGGHVEPTGWTPPAEVVALQKAWHVAADGHWGGVTDAAMHALLNDAHGRSEQAVVGTTVDGVWGPHSKAAYRVCVVATKKALNEGLQKGHKLPLTADLGSTDRHALRAARARYYGK